MRRWASALLPCLVAALVVASAPAASGRPISARTLFREPAIRKVAVSPDGKLVAAYAYHRGTHGLLLQVVGSGVSSPLFAARSVLDFGWVDADTLLVSTSDPRGHRLLQLRYDEWGNVQHSEHRVAAHGWPIDLLPEQDDTVLWATARSSGGRVFRAPLSQLIDPDGEKRRDTGYREPVHADHRVALIRERVDRWIADADGLPRAALIVEDPERPRVALWYREAPDSSWRVVGSWEGEHFPLPIGMADDGRLYVLSAEGRDTRALRYYDVETEQLGEVAWSHPQHDVIDVVYDYSGHEVISVVYESGGLRRYHHLDDASSGQRWIDERYPQQNVVLTSRTGDGRFSTFRVSGPTNPGEHYFADARTKEFVKVGVEFPNLDTAKLAPVESLTVTTSDGLEIESYLAMPKRFAGDRPPLVVMPHGGPIGVRDTRDFNPWVQYLASAGLAVLQVNYRGSSGRGRRFLEAGKGGVGERIEQDIELAVDRVVEEGRVDPARMCVYGWSYGGYSALIGSVRRPDRYRCAIAGAAPTDLLLIFDSTSYSEDLVEWWSSVIGDPDVDRERLIRLSPAYRVPEIPVPLLLIHGTEDMIVDVEHAWRMRAMLDAHGKPFEWMLVDGMGHSGTTDEEIRVLVRVRSFLTRHLIERPGS